jgi:hypothetical protein
MVSLGVILMSLFLLASCRPGDQAGAAVLAQAAGNVSISGSTQVDYEQAADNHAARWQAMAQFYADHDMLKAAASPEAAGIVYAMAPVDLKLFNTGEVSPASKPSPVAAADRKFFYSNYLNGNGSERLAYEYPANR